MSTAARIDELRKKFDENPRRYFAPLANELRKAGDLSQAIALCREHLPKQPGHMSGYIVYGQALYESGTLDEARLVFEQALTLDPENLIALRHLGDIAKASGDTSSARRWYERVLDADPRNDDIASQLVALSAMSIPALAAPTTAIHVAYVPTPMHSLPAIGLPAVPTPDAALRAVDFDVVNARIAHFTPLDLDAIESAGTPEAPPAPRNATPALSHDAWSDAATVDAPSDLSESVRAPATDDVSQSFTESLTESFTPSDAIAPRAPTPVFADASRDVLDALDAFAAHDPSDELLASDAFVFGSHGTPTGAPLISRGGGDGLDHRTASPVSADAAASVSDDLADGDALAFEEGIMAPEWPDTSELLSRVGSPRFVTPTNVTSIPDAVAAFGREAGDLVPEIVAEDSSLTVDGHSFEFADAAALPAVSEQLSEELSEELSAELSAETPIDEAADSAPPRDTPWNGASSLTVEETPRLTGPAAGGDDESDSPALASTFDETELPWLAALSGEVIADDSARAIDELADAFALDARGVGDDDDVRVSSIGPDTAASADVSFADVLELGDASSERTANDLVSVSDAAREAEFDANPVDGSPAFLIEDLAEEASDDTSDDAADDMVDSTMDAAADLDFDDAGHLDEQKSPSSSPAFVTETMAELLVSQGFTARAVTVYEELVRRQPYDPVLTSRLAELRTRLAEESAEHAAASATPAFPTPAFPTPASPTSGYATPTFSMPAFPSPAYPPLALSSPAFVTPAFSASPIPTPASPTPAYPTPAYGTPAYPTPTYATPAYPTPDYASPAISGAGFVTPAYAVTASSFTAIPGGAAARMTARERFALLAARRVPRRTPPQPFTGVEEHVAAELEGLSALFGDEEGSPVSDDAAARALADAFAPMSDLDSTSDGFLGFIDGDGTDSDPQTSRGSSTAEEASFGVTGETFAGDPSPGQVEQSNAGFSFDRFFPDPARPSSSAPLPSEDSAAEGSTDAQPHVTPPPPPPDDPQAPAGDDLAQFSAWLKGLGPS